MGRERGLKAVLAVEFLGEFLRRLVAEGIADDDEHLPVLGLFGVEARRIFSKNSYSFGTSLIFHWSSKPCESTNLPQGKAECRDVPVRVSRLNLLPKLLHMFQCCSALIGRLAEVPVELVEVKEFVFVGAVHSRGVVEVESLPMEVPQIEEFGGGNQGLVDGV